ncbi:MAG: pyridoxamine 5'-phosphate oxidase family protein, partial [Candidatus Heimdallarchaeota archaeon]|nr:pyridoxamine 5'-phosphate oxidase family protein [Candidatus Heimdallarchaeota archaeon]
DNENFEYIVKEAKIGQLAMMDNNDFPRIIPLNFVVFDKIVYFHGAKAGEKWDLIKKKPKCSFNIDIPYSFIPSYTMAKSFACPATHFFKSIHIRGTVHEVQSMKEKSMALQGLMEKFQPEGNYLKITDSEPVYRKELENVGVFKVIPIEITIKMKFGQNLNEKNRSSIIDFLEKRNIGRDRETIEEMKKLRIQTN